MKSLEEIRKILANNKQQLFQEYPIKSMAIFGSYARGEQNKKSDLDIVVEFEGRIGIRFVDLAEEIENLLGTKIDLVSKKGIKKKYFRNIKSELIYV